MMTQSVPGISSERSTQVRVAALIASCACLLSTEAQTARAPATGSLTPALAAERKVGIAYSTWHNSRPWGKTCGTPTLGQYLSNDPAVIRHHAEWLVSANVDFIYIDWSNDIDTGIPGVAGQGRQIYLEETTTTLFEQYTRLPVHPQVAIMMIHRALRDWIRLPATVPSLSQGHQPVRILVVGGPRRADGCG
jgi:hypothetical protein